MSPRLPRDVASTAAVEAWDKDALRNSVVELLVLAGSWCKWKNCDNACMVAFRTDPESMKYMTGSKQLLRADSSSMASLVRSMSRCVSQLTSLSCDAT